MTNAEIAAVLSSSLSQCGCHRMPIMNRSKFCFRVAEAQAEDFLAGSLPRNRDRKPSEGFNPEACM